MIVNDFANIPLKNSQIIRLLSRKRKKPRNLDSNYIYLINSLKVKARKIIEPKAVYAIIDQRKLPKKACFEDAEKVGLAICTIGKKLPKEVNNLISKGNLVDAVILDAIGSIGVESVADVVNKILNDFAKKNLLEFSTRYSPGYCSWKTSDQQIIFNHLPAHEIDVHLTDSFMMNPIKSVSFAINIGSNVNNTRWQNRCKFCEQIEECSYRMH